MNIPASGRPALADWGEQFTCHTGALASWAARESPAWWRQLASGGPVLRAARVGDLFRFEHSAVAPARSLGLTLATAPDWSTAWAGLRDELETRGRVVVAGDTFWLPWHRQAYQVHHATRWFLLSRSGIGYTVEDPLSAVNEVSRQGPALVELAEPELAAVCRALGAGTAVVALRESASLGVTDPALGAGYRWLRSTGPQPRPAEAMGGGDDPGAGIRRIRTFLAEHRAEPDAYRQADDLWHASRQRDFVVRALAAERDRGADVADPDVWAPVADRWRTVPPLLMYARLLAESGRTGHDIGTLLDTLAWLADAEEARADQRFPICQTWGGRSGPATVAGHPVRAGHPGSTSSPLGTGARTRNAP